MAEEIRFRSDLFKVTAYYYEHFGPPYPPPLLEELLTWQIDSLIGFVYSSSTLNRTVLRGHVSEFEADVRRVGAGPFTQRTTAAYELARLPS